MSASCPAPAMAACAGDAADRGQGRHRGCRRRHAGCRPQPPTGPDPRGRPARSSTAPAIMAVGSRYIDGGATPDWPWRRRLLSRLGGLLAWPLTELKDPMSGFFAVREERLLEIDPKAAGFKIGLEVIARGGGCASCEGKFRSSSATESTDSRKSAWARWSPICAACWSSRRSRFRGGRRAFCGRGSDRHAGRPDRVPDLLRPGSAAADGPCRQLRDRHDVQLFPEFPMGVRDPHRAPDGWRRGSITHAS